MRWYYVNDAQERVPAEEVELPSLVRSGLLRSNSLVWHEGRTDWAAAGELLPELFLAHRPTPAGGADAPLARLSMDPLLSLRGWILPLAIAMLVAAAVQTPAAWNRLTNDTPAAAGMLVRIGFLVGIACLLIAWLVRLARASRTGDFADIRSAARSGGRVLALTGVASLFYLLSVLFTLISTVASKVAAG